MKSQIKMKELLLDWERRVHPRTSLLLRTEVELDGMETRGWLRNLSARGAQLDLDVVPDIGMSIHLSVRNIGRIRGRVIWIDGRRVGVQFDARIDPMAACPARPSLMVVPAPPVQTDHRRPSLGRFGLKAMEAPGGA